ncbi:BREX system Lon protease-like protein BrxL [Sulfolobus tengchongensis]|uniref:BREX system Lon protease-like protein BrxL n=1 Tax=Sulfolobus tengchongensis TaxID=207809 RepID=A0AAX4L1N4_9CREN
MSDLFAKVRSAFGDYAVDKSLKNEADLTRLPGFVAEYLMTEFSLEDPNNWMSKLRDFVKKYYFDASEKEYVKHKLVTEGTIKLIDELRVWVDIDTGEHKAVVPTIGENNVRIPKDIVNKNPMTLVTGMWGLITLQYSPESVRKDDMGNPLENPIVVTEFKPFQAPTSDPKILAEGRENFSLIEWLDVLINTIGYNHEVYSNPKRKLTLISRLLPLIEDGLHIVEFGPKATGKTYIYRNVSRYTRIIVGGTITPASLFYNLRTGMPGEIAIRDSVIFDEIAKVKMPNPDEIVAKLKDFMESGQFERGKQKVTSGCSMVILGNVEVELQGDVFIPVEDMTYLLPQPMRDSALIDRIGGIIPGWELPKIGKSKQHLSHGYGIALDYFSEVMHTMKKDTLTNEISKYIELGNNVTIRDEKAIKKLVSALMKLLFPNLQFDNSELKFITEFAIEMRQRVREWLHKLSPGEFQKDKISFVIKG